MRYVTGGIALGAALALGGLVGIGTSASAAPTPIPPAHTQSLYAPSALVLTVGQGDSAAQAGVQRAVTLTCTPKATGSHPDASGACAQLRAAGGDFDKITTIKSGTFCTREWNPIVVTAQGVWEGKRVSYEHTFANPCEMKAGKGTVFEF
ncbi:protease inhibitor protein [Streptomyces cinnamoneus]|uniref:Probable subtilase-type protease inhibitor n=1 Tax=Streptomyces cinnamoneus TaxID=53446 RepID=A0A2G1XB55_STRCJ|nr:subtilase-type protease inhibitor [Streptomyces cinnamoneus]PHQ48445.1 protease inhibitor protein [Streptomyces cinnamoneus]PPT12559.1 protease inhibitor protein [Streptomyces cinnamoneus]